MTDPVEEELDALKRQNEELSRMIGVLEQRIDLLAGLVVVLHLNMCEVLSEEQQHAISDEMADFIASFSDVTSPFP